MIQSKDYADRVLTLVDIKTGKPIDHGTLVTVRGDELKISGGRAPHKPGSTGRVWVQDLKNGAESEFFPGVVNAQWVPYHPAVDFQETRFMPLGER